MTNARQVREIYKPLVAKYGDLAPAGNRFLCLRPVHHVALRVFIERSSHADYCVPLFAMLDLFQFDRDPDISIGIHRKNLFRPNSSLENHWTWSDPSMITDAIFVIENEALPLMRSLDTLEEFTKFYRREPKGLFKEWPEERLITDIALGELTTARNALQELLPKYEGRTYPEDTLQYRWGVQVTAVAEPLLDGDRQALAAILHGWEAENVRGTKLERYWEPTPFPLETREAWS